jgi:hypothetical protein
MTVHRSRRRPRRRLRQRRVHRPLIESDLDEDEEVEIGGEPDREAPSPAAK